MSTNSKKNLQAALLAQGEDWTDRKIKLDKNVNLWRKKLCDFVDSSSVCALKSLRIALHYYILTSDPENWSQSSEYQEARKIVKNLKVVNDPAERKIELITDFNGFKLLSVTDNVFQKLKKKLLRTTKRFNNYYLLKIIVKHTQSCKPLFIY
jgi:hypothetical protein